MYMPNICNTLDQVALSDTGRERHYLSMNAGDCSGLGTDVHAAPQCIPTCVVKLVHDRC